MTRVSVAVAVHDDERYVGEALDSVLSELGSDDEVVVVNDGSTDGTADVLASYGERIRVLEPGRVGLSAARNLGVRSGTGRYVTFIDADDLWVPGSLQAKVDAMEASGADVALGMTDEFMDEAIADPESAGLRPAVGEVHAWFLGAMIARRTAFSTVLFDERQPLAITVDWLGRARAAGFRFHQFDTVTLRRRIRAGSMTGDAEAYHGALLGALRANIGARREQS